MVGPNRAVPCFATRLVSLAAVGCFAGMVVLLVGQSALAAPRQAPEKPAPAKLAELATSDTRASTAQPPQASAVEVRKSPLDLARLRPEAFADWGSAHGID